VPGRPDLVAHQAPDIFALWQAWEEESGARQDVPFWGVVWPAARMLAGFLESNPEWVRGRNVVDLGCGGGVAALASARAGARRVCANDIDPAALEMTARNAAANDVHLHLDGADLIDRGWPGDTGVILVSDLFYEQAMSQALEERLRGAVREGVSVLVADSSRPFAPRTGIRMLAEERFSTDWELEGSESRLVRLFTLPA
jgi:predicted nicotinamide N-methyase